ncbi:Maf family nucleotide pyrophosphatase [Celeribacter halophilus]|uniref:Nucleoside triphosphate pyrophosphatase n=1 Tax=Celeribacter halophilus TaxID=576117 RepID=A0AAW7XSI7_9RHOB|nr:Maf family nucleotide pyrophosphatase [Celeribacter halophilus]MDO6456867.1 Maf family nucleotide pyrophosphatase [Celeribacter halophilus]MDO6723529.1 Maf family nucleotide pyrophosphatase [Celeribacter halophilus]
MNTSEKLILASGSEIRQTLLRNAGVSFDVSIGRIDEESVKDALLGEGASPRDIADALAEGKARKVSLKNLDAMVIGCDQTLSFKGRLLSKPKTVDEAREQLKEMRGERHKLLSAAVIYENGEPKWRHVGEVRLEMNRFSDAYLEDYLARNWEQIRHCVGSYMLESEGVRLFSRIDGDYFTVLGLPLLPLLAYLSERGVIAS